MIIVALLKRTGRIIVAVPTVLRKGLRKIVTILSPRTVPSVLTITVKAGVGLLMINTSKFLKFLSFSSHNPNPLLLQSNEVCMAESNSMNFLDKMGAILLMDSALDLLKIGSMMTLHLKNKMLGETGEEENFNSAVNAKNYREIYKITAFLSFTTEVLFFVNMMGMTSFISEWYNGSREDIQEVLTELHAPPKMSGLMQFATLFGLGLLTMDFYFKYSNRRSESFGNQPWIGGTTAAMMISSINRDTEIINEFAAFSDHLNQHETSVSMFDQIPRLKKLADKFYQNKYNSAYQSLLETYHANPEARAKQMAALELNYFKRKGDFYIRDRLQHKDIHKFMGPIGSLYASHKLYKNLLIILENTLDLWDTLVWIDTHRPKSFKPAKPPKRTGGKALAQFRLRVSKRRPKLLRDNLDEEPAGNSADNPADNLEDIHSAQAASNTANSRRASVSGAGIISGSGGAQPSAYPPQPTVTKGVRKITHKKRRLQAGVAEPLIFSTNDKFDTKNDDKGHADMEQEIDGIESKEEADKLARKKEILSHYQDCDKELLRSILDGSAKRVSKKDVCNLAEDLDLDVEKTKKGAKIDVYKDKGAIASYHRVKGKTDPGFISGLADAFASVDITTDDLDALDQEEVTNSCACSNDVLSSIQYVLTTRPRVSSRA